MKNNQPKKNITQFFLVRIFTHSEKCGPEKAPYLDTFSVMIMSHEKPCNSYYLLIKTMALEQPHFRFINILSGITKTCVSQNKNFIYYIITIIALECFRIVKHTYAVVSSIKTRFNETGSHFYVKKFIYIYKTISSFFQNQFFVNFAYVRSYGQAKAFA